MENFKIIIDGVIKALNWILLALSGLGVSCLSILAFIVAVVFAPKCDPQAPGCTSEAHHPYDVLIGLVVMGIIWAIWISWFVLSTRVSEDSANRFWLPMFWIAAGVMAAAIGYYL